MATVQEPTRVTPRHESFVEAELARARRRIRSQDVGIAALGLAAGTLAYALGMVLLDRWLELPSLVRQLALAVYVVAAAGYVALVLLRPFRREVNPYFAARQVERAVPGAKNSVVSWLDLRDQPLPPSIRNAVGLKAASDLKRADLDEVVRDRRLPLLSGTAGGLFLAAVILFFLLRPAQFLSLLGRAFTPFGSTAIATRTELTLLQPAGGDVTVPINTSVEFRVVVSGRVPDANAADAVRLRYRYNPADPVGEELRLAPTPNDPQVWGVRLLPNQVQNGFVYQVVGGDAVTPEFHVRVRSTPMIEGVDVVYHYRPYLRYRDLTTHQPNLEALRGTVVTLTVRTNRAVAGGSLVRMDEANRVMADVPPLPAQLAPEQPNALRFQFVMDQDGAYTVHFQSVEGETNQEPRPYKIKVLSDYAPQVDVTRPAPDTLPVNGTLQVEGKASDDFGIAKMRLCLQVKDNADAPQATRLADKPYRPEKKFEFADGTYPQKLDYLDVLAVDQFKTPLGVTVEPKPGLVIEYWLEAIDNCDYPDPQKPNVGRSKVYRTTLAAPQEEKDKQEQAQGAANDKQKHEQQQDAEHAKENETKKEQAKAGDADPNAQQQPPQGDPEKPAADPKDQELEQKARDLQEKMQQRERDKDKGEGKGEGQEQPADPSKPSEPKGEPKNDGGQQGANPQQQPGEPKGDPKGSGQQQPGNDAPKGEGKNEGKTEQPQEPGDVKPQPNADQQNANPGQNQQPGAGRSGDNRNQTDPQQSDGQRGAQQQKPETNPGEPKPQPQQQPNAGENKAPPQQGEQPGAPKPAEGAKSGDPNPSAGDPNAVNPPQRGDPNQQRGNPNSQPANQRGSDRGDPKSGTSNQPPSGDRGKDDKSQKDQKEDPGRGNTSGNRGGPGERSGAGPKQDPNANNPNTKPEDKQGRDGAGSKTGSGQPGGTPPQGTKPEQQTPEAPGQGGKPEPQQGEAKDRGAQQGPPEKADVKPNGDAGDGNDPGREAPGAAKGDPLSKGEVKDAPKPGEGGPKPQGDAKTEGAASDGKPQGDTKPDKAPTPAGNDPSRGGEKGAAKPDSKPADGQGRKPTSEDINKLAEQLKNADPATRQEVLRKLEELQKQMGDAKAQPATEEQRQAAEQLSKVLDDARRGGPQADRPPGAGGDTNPRGQDQRGRSGTDQSKAQSKTDQHGAPKPGDQTAKGQPDPSKSGNRAGAGDPNGKAADGPGGDKTGQPGANADPPQAGSTVAGNSGAGSVNAQSHNTERPSGAVSPAEAGPPPDANHAAKTGDLQLEKFPKNPDPDLLKDLKMTPDEYRDFFQKLADYAKRQQAAQAADANNLQRGSGRGSSAANSSANRVEGGANKAGDLNRGGSLPPPEYRDGYKAFTEDVSKTAGQPKTSGPPKKN